MDYLIGDIKDEEIDLTFESVYVPQTESSSLVVQDFKPILDIKEEPDDIDDEDIIDDSVKVEEGCVNAMKLEDEDRAPSQEIEAVYLSESNHIVISPTIYCYRCNESYVDFCPKCPMLIRILDTMVRRGTPDRAFKTLPNKLLHLKLGESGGVFAKRLIPIGVTFGPFQGLKNVKIHDGRYFFPGHNQQIVCNDSYENSNWLQFIRYSSNYLTTNLVMIQSGGQLFYRTRVVINEGEPLSVLTADFNQKMVYFEPIKVDKIGPVYPCLMCCLGYSLKIDSRRHWKKCPYSGVSMFKILEENSRIESAPELLPLTNKPIPEIPNGSNASLQDTSTYKCCICNKILNGLNNLKRHSDRTHNITDDLRSANPSLHNADLITPTNTLNNVQDSSAIQCEICNKTFANKRVLSQHIQIHSDTPNNIPVGRLRCSKCPKTFMKMKTYNGHVLLHKLIEENKVLQPQVFCRKCSKWFPNRKELDKHAVEHTKKKKSQKMMYKCSYCDFYSEKKCIDFVQHMLHKYDKATSVATTT